jgi:hypothetical protein
MIEGRSTKKEPFVAKTAKKKKTASRRPYSKADVKELKAHSKARTPVAKIARLTKRTVGSLRQKARQLGLGLGHQR